jgi:hypothetical protein
MSLLDLIFVFVTFSTYLLILLNIFHYHAIKTTKSCKTNGKYRQLAHWRRTANGSLEQIAVIRLNESWQLVSHRSKGSLSCLR